MTVEDVICVQGGERYCIPHGAPWTPGGCLTRVVLDAVSTHRAEQFERYGDNRQVPDGTGPGVRWLPTIGATAEQIEEVFRDDWDWVEGGDNDPGQVTWLKMLREEVAEAFASDGQDALYDELIQVSALAASWAEKVRERRLYQYGFPMPSGDVVTTSWYHEDVPIDGMTSTLRRRPGGEWEEVPS